MAASPEKGRARVPESGPAPIIVKLVALRSTAERMEPYGVMLSAMLTPGYDALHR
jgi:hypothetical protein